MKIQNTSKLNKFKKFNFDAFNLAMMVQDGHLAFILFLLLTFQPFVIVFFLFSASRSLLLETSKNRAIDHRNQLPYH